MIPTLTDLTKTAINDNASEVVVKGANDGKLEGHVVSTIDRIVAKYNAHDDLKLNNLNDKVDAVQATISKILDKHNYNAGAPRWSERRNAANTQEYTPNGIVDPVDHSSITNRTLDRMMNTHGYYGTMTSKANDNYRDILGDYLFHPDELPDFANDWRSRRKKPDIYRYNDKVPQAKRTVSEKKKTTEKTSHDKELLSVLQDIQNNTYETNELLIQLVASTDDLGIDSLRAREREYELSNNYMAGQGNSILDNSERDKKGKTGNTGTSMLAYSGLALGGISAALMEDVASQYPDSASKEDVARSIRNKALDWAGEKLDVSPEARAALIDNLNGDKKPDSVVSGNFTGREKAFLELISKREGANYNTEFANGKYGSAKKMFGKDLTELSINEVFQLQTQINRGSARDGWGNGRGTSAVGKGQFIKGTLKEMLLGMGYKESQFDELKYTPELQDKLILHTARNKRQLDPNKVESWDKKDLRNLGLEWESLDVAKGKISASDLQAELSRIKSASKTRAATNSGVKKSYTPLVNGERVVDETKLPLGLGKVKKTENDSNFSDMLYRAGSRVMEIYDDVSNGDLFVVRSGSQTHRRLESTAKPKGKELNNSSASKEKKQNVVVNHTTVNNGARQQAAPTAQKAKPNQSLWQQFTDWFD